MNGESPATTPPAQVSFAPGTRFRFASENYSVIQQIAADMTGEPFDTTLRSLVGEPLGLTRTGAYQTLPPNRRATAATGHDETGAPLPGGWRVYPEVAASGIWTTPREYAVFLTEVLRAMAGKSSKLLNPETAKLLRQSVARDDDSEQTMGFGIYERNDVPFLFRGGNTAGYYCHLDADWEQGNAIIVFANGNLCWRLANEVRDAVGRAEGFRGFVSER
ncbi:MAG: hypothetical protein OHK0029_01780 [Armatimonadaceae bacterium]